MDSRGRRLALLAGACVAIAALPDPASAASGGSIVFIRKGNIWLMRPDGTRQRRVTRGGGWSSPSQADNGVIFALRHRYLVRLSRRGRRIGHRVALIGTNVRHSGNFFIAAGPDDARVSPNGRRVAYWFGSLAQNCNPVFPVCDQDLRDNVVFTRSNRFTSPTTFGRIRDYREPSWASNRTVILFNHGLATTVVLNRVGSGEQGLYRWFDDPNGNQIARGQATRRNDKLAALVGRNFADSPQGIIRLYQVVSPAEPARPKCDIIGPAGAFDFPTWSPRGSSLAWADRRGISVARRIPRLDSANPSCAFPIRRIARGGQPFWGPKDVRRRDGLRRRRR
jgi:hypothetical protein